MTDAQEKAGLAAMRGTFTHADVRRALQRANVPIESLDNAVDSLIRQEREAGRIRHEQIEGAPITQDDRWIKVRV